MSISLDNRLRYSNQRYDVSFQTTYVFVSLSWYDIRSLKKKKNPINGMVNFILWPRWNSAIIPNDWSFCYQIIQRFFGIANMNTISLWFCDKERPFRVHQVRRNVFTILQMNNDEYHEYLCSKMRLITLNDSSNEWLQYLHYGWCTSENCRARRIERHITRLLHYKKSVLISNLEDLFSL